MNIALFNVTNLVDKNPGCRATVDGLKKAISTEFTYQFPLGFGYEYFLEKKGLFSNFNTFSKAYSRFKNNKDYQRIIKTSDCIVINSEGTIHSDSIGAKTLLAFAKLGKEYKKKVYLVNGSYFNLSDELLEIIRMCDAVFSRETISHHYLLKNKIESTLVPDCAFLTKFENKDKVLKSCLYTPGVLFSYGSRLNENDVKSVLISHFKSMLKYSKEPYFLLIEEKERELAMIWRGLGGKVLDSTSFSTTEMLSEMSKFELVISGRYHILLFALMVNVKTIPLSSNTTKIAGLFTMLDNNIKTSIQDCFSDSIDVSNSISVEFNLNKLTNNILSAYKNLIS